MLEFSLINKKITQLCDDLLVDVNFLENIFKVFLDHADSFNALLVLIVKDLFLPLLVLELFLEVCVQFLMVTLISRRLKIHFLYGLLLFFNLFLNFFHFFCDLFNEPLHDGILFVKSDKDAQ